MNWVEDTISAFGRTIGIIDLALDDRHRVDLAIEGGGLISIRRLVDRGEPAASALPIRHRRQRRAGGCARRIAHLELSPPARVAHPGGTGRREAHAGRARPGAQLHARCHGAGVRGTRTPPFRAGRDGLKTSMSIKLRPNTLAPIERGIDRVVRDVGSSSELPDFVDLAPAETLAHSQLDQLLALPNIEEFVAAVAAAQGGRCADPHASRLQIRAGSPPLVGLRHAAEKQRRAARIYGRAARLLADERESARPLLYMYRSALRQG